MYINNHYTVSAGISFLACNSDEVAKVLDALGAIEPYFKFEIEPYRRRSETDMSELYNIYLQFSFISETMEEARDNVEKTNLLLKQRLYESRIVKEETKWRIDGDEIPSISDDGFIYEEVAE